MSRGNADELEFDLRSLRGVMNVGLTASADGSVRLIVVASREAVEAVRIEARPLADLYGFQLPIDVTNPPEAPESVLAKAAAASLLKAEFDPTDGCAEVTLNAGDRMATARSNSGPLIGGAEATLAALRDLGLEPRAYLAGVNKVDSAPDAPVVVKLHCIDNDEDHVGIGSAGDVVHSAASATLDAVGRCTNA